jgi:hypothetical protein
MIWLKNNSVGIKKKSPSPALLSIPKSIDNPEKFAT